jgi:hypothetical protein
MSMASMILKSVISKKSKWFCFVSCVNVGLNF